MKRGARATLREMVRLALAGVTCYQIAKKLQGEYPCLGRSRRWNGNFIRKILADGRIVRPSVCGWGAWSAIQEKLAAATPRRKAAPKQPPRRPWKPEDRYTVWKPEEEEDAEGQPW